MTDLVAVFDPYVRSFIRGVADVGYEETRCAWKTGHACGCMGPQTGEPFCPCQMNFKTVEIMDYLLTEVSRDLVDNSEEHF